MLRSLLIVLVAAGLTSCATIEPKRFVGPNGGVAFSMDCSGMGRTLDACFQKAGDLCPSGYNIVNRTTGMVAIPMSGGGFMAAPQHSLAIECK